MTGEAQRIEHLEKLLAETSQWALDLVQDQRTRGDQLRAERDALKSRVDVLEKALRWYAFDDSWRLDSDGNKAYIESSQAANDSGDRARTALTENGAKDE